MKVDTSDVVSTIDELWKKTPDQLKTMDWNCCESLKAFAKDNQDGIPFYGAEKSTNGSLVRWRCMIRNQLETVYSPQIYIDGKDSKTGLFKQVPADSPFQPHNLGERIVYLGVDVPHEECWVKKMKTEEVSDVHLMFYSLSDKQESLPKICKIIDILGVYYEKSVTPNPGLDEPLSVIHVIDWKESHTYHPKVPSDPKIFEKFAASFRKEAQTVRASLLKYISEWIGGDYLAAEYILAHLSSAIVRRNGNIITGAMSIGLSGIPANLGALFCDRLSRCIKSIFPRTLLIDLSLENLNKERWVPVKNHADDSLSNALLQMPDNTSIIINHTALTKGKVEATGLMNLKALESVALEQTVYYDFQYHSLPFHVDFPTIVVCEATPMVNCSIMVKLTNVSEDSLTLEPQVDEQLLECWRQYLTCARNLGKKVEFEEKLTEIIQDDFVENKEKMGAESGLHHRINLSRMITLSFLETTITADTYKRMIKLEDERLGKLEASI